MHPKENYRSRSQRPPSAAVAILLSVVHEEPVVRTHCSAWALLVDRGRGSARGKNIQITRGCPRLDVFALGARSSLVVVARAGGVIYQIRDRSASLLA